MDPELDEFISQLGNDEPFKGNKQMNEMWKELDDYFDKTFVGVDEFLNEILPNAKPPETFQDYLKHQNEVEPVPRIKSDLFPISFALPETICNDLVPDLKLDFKNNSLLPTEQILASIRQNIAMCSIKQPCYSRSTSSDVRMKDVSDIENDLNRLNGSKIDTIYDDWINILQNEKIHPGITVDTVVENIIQVLTSCHKNSIKSEIYDTVKSLFFILNNYIDRLTIEFADYKFFDDSHLTNLTQRFYEDALSSSNLKMNSLLEVLSNWIKMITQHFIAINNQRRQIEEKVSKEVINEAVRIYKTHRECCDDRNYNMSLKKKIVCQGILQAYSNCGSDFKALIQTELEKRLEDVDSSLENLNSTLEKSEKTPERNDVTVEMQLLISEYSRNIIRKGFQCPSISTLHQFDEVNRNCRANILRNFERQWKEMGHSLVDRNNLKKQLESELDLESKKNRLEYENKILKESESIGAKSSATRSHSIGIHFGFEYLSVTYFDKTNKIFKNIYGPSPNLVTFAPEGVFIGEIPLQSVRTFDMNFVLTSSLNVNRDVNALHDTKYRGEIKLVEIIASILMQIDKITKRRLHTTSVIKYAIAIPSCLNKYIQKVFVIAMEIGKLEGTLVLEQSALTTNFLHENHQFVIKNNDDYLITLIEHSDESCDLVVHEAVTQNDRRKIQITRINGFEKETGLKTYVKQANPGIHFALERIPEILKKRCRFIICCPPARREKSTQLIKKKYQKSKVHTFIAVEVFAASMIANGAALLSAIANENFLLASTFDLHCLTSIEERKGHFYRLKHYGQDMSKKYLHETSRKLNDVFEKQSRDFELEKAKAKQFLMGKTKDLEQSNFSEPNKQKHRQQLENNLKAVEEEVINLFAIRKIIDHWNDCDF